MSTSAQFSLPSADFPLGSIFETFPKATVVLERIVPTTSGMFPYFWVKYAPPERVTDVIGEHPSIRSLSLVDAIEDRGLFQADWVNCDDGILTTITESPATLLTARGTKTKWRFELRAENRSVLSRFQQYCHDHGIDVTLTRLYTASESHSGLEFDLTLTQHESLQLAYEEGYYDAPREVCLEDLACIAGVSRQSLGMRLRRGHRNLVKNTIID